MRSLLAEIFRSVHTIKGTTGFLGFKRLEKLAHAGENLLGLLREGKLTADRPTITGLLQLLDGLRSILKTIETEDSEGEGEDAALIARLEELQALKPAQPKAKQHARREGRRASSRCRACRPSRRIRTAQACPKRIRPALPAAGQGSKRKMRRSRLPRRFPRRAAEAEGDAAKPRRNWATGTAAESTLRVDVTLLNRMMNLVGELVLTRNQVLQATSADPNMTLLSRRLDMVTADLRESVMKARMQPVSNIFSKMPRIVRDLSQSLGRRVRLQMEGQETELDKSLLEAIKDPLTHAVRNSLDHGIEPPEVRQAAGKDPEGTLKLRASQEGSHVVIEVSDDGAGIAVEKVRQKAIERGLITPERAAQLGERELLQLIFLPGFSTAAAVTNVSGRGVGMDVVRTNVEKIGGKVEIDSRAGKGTTLRMRIPLTLAIIPALIVRSVKQSFALPQGALLELVHVPPEQAATAIEWMEGAPLYRLRGKLLPLVFLDRLLMPRRGAQDGHRAGQLYRRAGRRWTAIRAGGGWAGRSGGDCGQAAERGAQGYRAIFRGNGAGQRGSGADSGPRIDRHEGRSDHERREEEAARAAGEATDSERCARLEYLLVEAARTQGGGAAGRRAAHRAACVSRIEYIGYRPVLNFEGQLLPVEDSGGVLAASRGQSRSADHCGGVPRGQTSCGHRGFACAGCGRGRRPVRGRDQPARRRRDAAEESRDRRWSTWAAWRRSAG